MGAIKEMILEMEVEKRFTEEQLNKFNTTPGKVKTQLPYLLHDTREVKTEYGDWVVTRVPGGWIYQQKQGETVITLYIKP